MSRPNILLLIADDHRHSAIGALGQEAVDTPTFDRLMAQGTTFTRASIMGATSDAVCLPSRAMLLSGRGVFRTPDPLPVDTPLLPELLWQEGYCSFGTGKWHNHSESFARCFNAGGKVFLGGMSDQYAVPVYPWDAVRTQDESRLEINDTFSTTLFADETVRFLQSRSPEDEQPFFAWVAFTAPHDPRTPPGEYAERYNAKDVELPPNFMPGHPFDMGISEIRDELLAAQPRDEAEVRQHIADYYGMITHLDAEIGRILEALEGNGLAGNTIVIYCADHGLAVGQHGLMGKQNLVRAQHPDPAHPAWPGHRRRPAFRRPVLPARPLPHAAGARRLRPARDQRGLQPERPARRPAQPAPPLALRRLAAGGGSPRRQATHAQPARRTLQADRVAGQRRGAYAAIRPAGRPARDEQPGRATWLSARDGAYGRAFARLAAQRCRSVVSEG